MGGREEARGSAPPPRGRTDGADRPYRQPFVTVSASFGAGGSRIAPRLARRLGVSFFDRAIPLEVARRLDLPPEMALAQEENRVGAWGRLLASFVPLGALFGAAHLVPAEEVLDDAAYRSEADRVIGSVAALPEGGVLLGRAGAVVLQDDPRALHVRLDGPARQRCEAAQRRLGLDERAARDHQRSSDAAREAYVRQLYGVDPTDPSLYHLVLDSTCLTEEDSVELIASAAEARLRALT